MYQISHGHRVCKCQSTNNNPCIICMNICEISVPNLTLPAQFVHQLSPSNRKIKKYFARLQRCYFTLYKNITSTKITYFSKVYCYTSFDDLKVSSVSLPHLKFALLPYYCCLSQVSRKYGFMLSTNGQILTQNFVKFDQMI
jgi:hypothetical protein